MKVVDIFSFFNELDLLEIRLNELDSVVDRFILAEATKTHSGLDKPLYYEQNKDRFKKFWRKITHIIVDDMPMTREDLQKSLTPHDILWSGGGYQSGDNWIRERFQRNALMRGMGDCSPDDIIIIEDADEMVRPSVIRKIKQTMTDGTVAVEQTLCSYYLNVRCTNVPWWGSKIRRMKDVTNISEHRFHSIATTHYVNAGWHFNFWGGASAIQEKLKSYAHQEFNNKETLEKVPERLTELKDVLGRTYEYAVFPIDKFLPRYVLKNLDKFESHIYRGEKNED